MDACSTASSFYEAPEIYDEGKTRMLYENLKTNLHEVHKSLKSVQLNLNNLQKESLLTVKLIEKIESAKLVSNEKSAEN